jgi:hypothetical protein
MSPSAKGTSDPSHDPKAQKRKHKNEQLVVQWIEHFAAPFTPTESQEVFLPLMPRIVSFACTCENCKTWQLRFLKLQDAQGQYAVFIVRLDRI